MTARVAVVDTNVVVSGLLTSGIDTPTSRILDSMLSGALRFALSIELLAEYRSVLFRKKIRSRHGLDEAQIDTILTAFGSWMRIPFMTSSMPIDRSRLVVRLL